MAKFKITTSLITPLTDAGIIDGSGNIKIIFAYRPSGPNMDEFYELEFEAATDIIETTNQRMIDAITELAPPSIKVDGSWLVADPATARMFETTTGDPTIDPVTSGTRVVSSRNRELLNRYQRITGKAVPSGRNYATLSSWLTQARNFFAHRNAKR